jgi:hypothetical protein
VDAPPDGIMDGSADITDEQLADLEAGNYYVNVHTDKTPAEKSGAAQSVRITADLKSLPGHLLADCDQLEGSHLCAGGTVG